MTGSVMVQELTGTECGEWHVHTRDSIHFFDLDVWIAERQPCTSVQADPWDAPHRLRTIESCRFGQRGHWTMKSDGYLIDYYFRYASIIQRIDRVDAEERRQEHRQELNRLGQL